MSPQIYESVLYDKFMAHIKEIEVLLHKCKSADESSRQELLASIEKQLKYAGFIENNIPIEVRPVFSELLNSYRQTILDIKDKKVLPLSLLESAVERPVAGGGVVILQELERKRKTPEYCIGELYRIACTLLQSVLDVSEQYKGSDLHDQFVVAQMKKAKDEFSENVAKYVTDKVISPEKSKELLSVFFSQAVKTLDTLFK